RLLFFAKATGQTDPIYVDVDAARAAGYPDLPAPPTFFFAAELDSGASFRVIEDLKIPIAKLLHGEQGFTYHRPACVGDTVTMRSTIDD
ncbi:MaoC family dehydratase N-terminal domain-containing protein, partial [Acinetobacter baumannii]